MSSFIERLWATALVGLVAATAHAQDPKQARPAALTSLRALAQVDGVEVVHYVKRGFCEVRFIPDFGAGKKPEEERRLLLALAFHDHGSDVQRDVDCASNTDRDALDQLLRLARQKKLDWAIDALLNWPEPHDNIDGQLAEEFAGAYILPLARELPLDRFLDGAGQKSIAAYLCGWAVPRGETKKLQGAIRALKKHDSSKLALKLQRCLDASNQATRE